MKKFLKIFGIFIVLLIASIFLIPIIFKDDLIKLAKDTANDNLNAKVEFGDFDLSLISNFPNFSFNIKDVQVDNVGDFEGTTLAKIKELNLVIDLQSVLGGDEIKVRKIQIIEPEMTVRVLNDGRANYDIAKASDDTDKTSKEEEELSKDNGEFQLTLKLFSIEKANIIFDDHQSDMYASLKNYNFNLKGDFSENITDIDVHTFCDAIDYKMEGIKYMKRTKLDFKSVLGADLDKMKFDIKTNTLQLNELILNLKGWVEIIEDRYAMDINLASNETSFKSILSMLPAIYLKDFEDIQTSGDFGIKLDAKGTYKEVGEEIFLPMFKLDFYVKNAMFNYPDLPNKVENINIKLKVGSKGGDLDNTVVNLEKFDMKFAGNSFHMKLITSNPMSDPNIDMELKADLDLGKMKHIIEMEEGDALTGIIKTDMKMKGKVSTLEKEDYENFEALGNLFIKDLLYTSTELPYDVKIQNADLEFNPKILDLKKMDCQIGKGDYHLNGQLQNFIPYALTDHAELTGNVNYVSNYIDLDEFMNEDSADLAYAAAVEAGEIIEDPEYVTPLPENMNLKLNAKINKMNFEGIEVLASSGPMNLKDEKLTYDLNSKVFEGDIHIKGYYETTDSFFPTAEYKMQMEKVDVTRTIQNLNTYKMMMPMFESATGKIDLDFFISTTLDYEYNPLFHSMNGKGYMNTINVAIEDYPLFAKAAKLSKNEDLEHIFIKDTKIQFEINDGTVEFKPFNFKVGKEKKTNVRMYGWNKFDNTMKWTAEVQMTLGQIAQANPKMGKVINGSGLPKSDLFIVPLIIEGQTTRPSIKFDWSVVLDQIKAKAGSVIQDKIINEVKEKVQAKKEEVTDKAKKEAREKADKILADAQKQANRVKSEAKKLAAKTRKEGKNSAQKLMNEAGNNPVKKKLAEKSGKVLITKANKKADDIERTANNKADKIMQDARKKADKMIQDK